MRKELALAFALITVVLSSGSWLNAADDDDGPPGQKKKGVPPGLAKKGGLPPGQAKKQNSQGDQDQPAPTPVIVGAPSTPSNPGTPPAVLPPPTTSTPPAPPTSTPTAPPTSPVAPRPTTPAVDGQTSSSSSSSSATTATTGPALSKEQALRRARLDQQIAELDTLGQRAEVRDRLFTGLYRREQIPLSTVEAQAKAHPEVGVGGIYMANQIARRANVSAEQLIAEHDAGKSWGNIAGDHNVSVAHMEEVAAQAQSAAHEVARSARTAVPPAPPANVNAREATTPRARLDQEIAELDAMGQRPEVRDRLFTRLYVRNEIPLSTIEAQAKAHPEIGAGGIIMGNYIARRAKVTPEQIFAEHKTGKAWGDIAGDHKVALDKMLELAAQAKASARDAERRAQ